MNGQNQVDAFQRWADGLAAIGLKTFTYRRAMSALDWSQTTRRMEGGKHFRPFPYQVEMLETPYRDDVQMTAFQIASRIGKTETVMNMIGHSITEEPRRLLVCYPTVSQSEKWVKETLEKELFEPTPALSFMDRAGRNPNNTILHKIFPGGLLNVFGSNSPGEMRRSKGNFLFADEVDAFGESKTDEGDPLEIFWVRGSEYPDAIKVAASYPSVKGLSQIEAIMEGSDYRKWFQPCPHCGEAIVPDRSHLKYEPTEPEEAILEPPCCGEPITDEERREMVMAGEWRPTKAFTGVAGFWGCGMMSLHPVEKGFRSMLHAIAVREMNLAKAENPDRAKRVLINTFDALSYEPETVTAPEAHVLMGRKEGEDWRRELPAGAVVLKAGVDIQKRWKEFSVWAFGENRQKWLVDHRQMMGAYNDPRSWKELLNALAKYEIPHPDGGKVRLLTSGRPAVFVDASHWCDTVMGWTSTVRNLGVYAVQGSPTVNAPPVGKRRQNATPKAWVYPLGVNQMKENVYSWLTLPRPEPGEDFPPDYCHFPEWAHIDYFNGLTAEVGKEEKFRGEFFIRYECPSGRRNEPLDTMVYACCAFQAARHDLKFLRAQLAKSEEGDDGEGDDAPRDPILNPVVKKSKWLE